SALEEGGVVFISDKTYVIPSNQTEIIKKLENIFTSGEASEE
ncbi:MAG TPA: glutaredoxin, partial [Thermococcus paralvinellae]|nr:glutaredoxin [Thermococcus paralvinellae]